MTDKEKQFNRTFPNGLFNVNKSNLSLDEKRIISSTVKNKEWLEVTNFIERIDPRFKDVYIDVIDSPEHNAKANWNGFRTIGITYGMILNLFKASALLLNSKELFPKIDLDKELYTFDELLPLFNMSLAEIKMFEESPKEFQLFFDLSKETPNIKKRIKPLSPERYEIAAAITHIALFFIIGHELCHVINHGKKYLELTKKNQISEYVDTKFFDSKIILDLRSLELDADRFGAINSFWGTVVLWQAKGNPLKKYFSGPSYVWMISILGVFFSFELSKKKLYPEKYSYHPVPKIRQNYSMNYIYDLLKDEYSSEIFGENYFVDFASVIIDKSDSLELLFNISDSEKEMMKKEFDIITSNLKQLQKQIYYDKN